VSNRYPPPHYQGPPPRPFPFALVGNLLGGLVMLGCLVWFVITTWSIDPKAGSLVTAAVGIAGGFALARLRSDG
jgi:hypothetical protein